MWVLIASFPNLGDNSPRFLSLSVSMCVCANYQNTPMPWQQHQAASFWGCLRRRRGKAFPLLSQADMWCSCWAVTRTHHTHRLHSHPSMHRLKPPPPPLSVSPPLSPTYMSISLPTATCQHSHQSVCPPSWQNQWDVLGAGVDTATMYKARATWLEYIVTSGQFQDKLCFCQFCHDTWHVDYARVWKDLKKRSKLPCEDSGLSSHRGKEPEART